MCWRDHGSSAKTCHSNAILTACTILSRCSIKVGMREEQCPRVQNPPPYVLEDNFIILRILSCFRLIKIKLNRSNICTLHDSVQSVLFNDATHFNPFMPTVNKHNKSERLHHFRLSGNAKTGNGILILPLHVNTIKFSYK